MQPAWPHLVALAPLGVMGFFGKKNPGCKTVHIWHGLSFVDHLNIEVVEIHA